MNREGGHTHLWEEHLQQWLKEANPEKISIVPPNPTWCIKLLEIIQSMWETGSIPAELGWTLLVLIPKVNADTEGIELIEVVWKLR